MTKLTEIYNDVAERRKLSLDYIGRERRDALIVAQMRREEELIANLEFVDRAHLIKGVASK